MAHLRQSLFRDFLFDFYARISLAPPSNARELFVADSDEEISESVVVEKFRCFCKTDPAVIVNSLFLHRHIKLGTLFYSSPRTKLTCAGSKTRTF